MEFNSTIIIIFKQRDWQGQRAFCLANNFTILTLNNKVEEQLIVAAFGGGDDQFI